MLSPLVRLLRDSRVARALVPPLGTAGLRWVHRSLRVRHLGREHVEAPLAAGERVICAFWHGQLLMMPFAYPGETAAVLISQHRDGEAIAGIAVRLGLHVVRGSARRGGARAFRQMLGAVRGGWNVAITPDGPRGPRRQVKVGVVELARRSGAPIVPVAFAAARARVLRSTWDQFLVPLPGSRAAYVWGESIRVPPAADRAELAKYQHLLADRLDALTAEAEALAAQRQQRSDLREFGRSDVRE